MITLDVNIESDIKHLNVKEETFFNSMLCEHPKLIRKLIKSIHPLYKISDAFFSIVNNFVDFDQNGVSLYGGLIVRTDLGKYAVLYLVGSEIDEEYLIKLVEEHIHDMGDYTPEVVDIDKFEVSRKVFINALKNI